MKAAVCSPSSEIEIQDLPIPKLENGDLLLQVKVCGVCGTDVRKIQHQLISKPTVLGHEIAGDVVEVGKNVVSFRPGDRVAVAHHTPCYVCHYCQHKNFSMCKKFKTSQLDPGGFSEFVRIPSDHTKNTAFRFSKKIPYEWAAQMEPLACALRNVKKLELMAGDTIVVVGLGSMGILTGLLIQSLKGKVIATDLKKERRTLGAKLGFSILDGSDPKLSQTILDFTQGRGADGVVLTAGNSSLYSEVVRWVRDGGKISIFAGLDPKAQVSYKIEEIYHREITIFSSYSSSPKDLQESLELIQNQSIPVDVLTPKKFPLSALSKAVQSVVNQIVLKAMIQPQE